MEFGLLNTIQSAIFLALDIYIWAKAFGERRNNDRHRYYTWLTTSVMAEQLMSLLVRMFKTKLVYGGATVQYAAYIAMLISMAFSAWSAMRYLLYLSGMEQKRTSAQRLIMLLPGLIMSLSALAAPWTHRLFYLDASLNYHRGSLFFLQLVCPYFYAFASLIMIVVLYFRDKKKNDRRAFRYFRCFIVPTVAGMALQVVANVDGGYSAIGMSVCILLLYVEFYIDEVHEIERSKDERLKEELIRNNARLFALEDNFESLYDVDLASGDYEVFIKGQTFSEKVSTRFVEQKEFFADSYKNIDAVAYPDDREEFKRVVNREHIKKELEAENHFDYYYRLLIDDEPVWFRMRVVYRDEEKKNVIIGIFNASKDIEAKQLAVQKEKLEESLTFTDYFLNTYLSAYYIDLDTGKYTIYKSPGSELAESFYDCADYLPAMTAFFRMAIHPEDVDKVIALIQPETIRTLTEKGDFSHYFRDISSGTERVMKIQLIRGADKDHAAIGFIDVTEEYREQQNRLLGAIPLSSDILTKANIGLWSFELDEGQAPRMYGDEAMLKLVGLDHQVPPEDMYHAWYDHIDKDAYGLVTDAVAKMTTGEHAEVQYPWHYPDGRTIMVRCGGVRNYDYKKGIRIEGTHQDVTQTLHFDEKERQRAKQIENDLIMAKLRADSLAFISDNEPDLDSAINFFGKRILEISGCDQVVYRELDGHRIVLNAPGIEDVPQEICAVCPFARFDCKAFEEDGTVLMNDCRKGYHGVFAPSNCPAKSSYMQMIYSGGKLVGKLTVHYLNDRHTFLENGISIMKTVAIYLGLLIGRINEKKAEIARIEAELSSKAKTEFLFNMSHDIRTPMNAILGYTDIGLRCADDAERSRDSFRKIRTAGGHLLDLINDILEMSRIESGALELDENPVDIRQSIDGITQMSYALAMSKDIDFKVEYGEIKDPYVYADELHANEIVVNLLSNAIKYTQEGGRVRLKIDQISDVIGGRVRFRLAVSDNGIGMSEEFQQHLFEAFSREKTSTVSRQEGAGLGLSIVRKIVDLAGGTISVKSKPGEGSTFTVELPFRVMDDAAIAAFKAANDNDEAAFAGENDLSGRKALLVEDNEMNREIATEILSETGLMIETAEDGAVAVKKVSEKGAAYYDFILMDIQMPVMNGYEATAQIRTLPEGDRVPIIALSANAFREDVEKSLAAGMNAHVAKPINVKELLGVLASFL